MTFADDVIYLDHAATTPVDAEVLQAMQPYFSERFGNPSSVYQLGQEARAALDGARGSIARTLGCHPSEILFTGGATESNNLALVGTVWAAKFANPNGPPPHLISSGIEHHAVLHSAEWLERQGFSLTVVDCDADGLVSPESIEAAIRPETCLISVMCANNEVGAIQPVAEIAEIAKSHGVALHVDAVQAAGMLPLSVNDIGCDLLSLSAHKFYGPKGVGVLYLRKGSRIEFQQHGGGQEGGRRGGTENVPGIVGMAVALEKAEALRERYVAHCSNLRNRLWDGIRERLDDVELNGPGWGDRRLANNLNCSIAGVQGETVLLSLDMQGVAASAGSACTTGNAEPSHVLLAMGHSEARARTSLRFTVGRQNTPAQIDEAAEILADSVTRIRELAMTR